MAVPVRRKRKKKAATPVAPTPTGQPTAQPQPEALAPFETLEAGETWLTDNDIAKNVLYQSPRPKLWGPKTSKTNALTKMNIVTSELDSMQRRFGIKLPKIDNMHFTGRPLKKAATNPLPGRAGWTFNAQKPTQKKYFFTLGDEWQDQLRKNLVDDWSAVKRPWSASMREWSEDVMPKARWGELKSRAQARHEVGHIVDYNFNVTAMPEFRAVWAEAEKAGFTIHDVSQYGATKVRELWAEMFSWYTSPWYGRSVALAPGLGGPIEAPLRMPGVLEDFIQLIINKMKVPNE